MGYIGSVDYSAIKSSDVLLCGIVWMNLKNLFLGERSQSQGSMYSMIPFIGGTQNK